MAGLAQGAGGLAQEGNGAGGRTRIINLAKTNMTQAELQAALEFLAAGGTAGTDDGPPSAGVSVLTENGIFPSGTTDNVQVAIPRYRRIYSGFQLWYWS